LSAPAIEVRLRGTRLQTVELAMRDQTSVDFAPARNTSNLAVYIVVKYEGFVRATVSYCEAAASLHWCAEATHDATQ